MKVAFAMIFKNEASMLQRNLPKIPRIFEKYIFIDTGSTDGSYGIIQKEIPEAQIILHSTGKISEDSWRQRAVHDAETTGCDWFFSLDADEAMLEEDFVTIFKYIEKTNGTLYSLPRLEFVNDDQHYITESFPDPQRRVFKLNMGYYYAPWVHSTVFRNGNTAEAQFLPQVNIFHYGGIKNHTERWLYYYNIERQQQGLPAVTEYPPGYQVPVPYWVQKNYPIRTFYGRTP